MKANCVKNHHLVRDHVDVSDLAASEAVLTSVVHVVPKDHVCAHGPSVARGHVDVCDLGGCSWSVLAPDAILM